MKCPNDNTTLVMTDRSGVEMDYCPECRGVWLDRGELDKIIKRSSQQNSENQTTHFGDNRHNTRGDSYPRHKKKESFLGDLFDF